MKYVFTENPELEQWMRINKFTFRRNIEVYFREKHFRECDEVVINKILGSLRQANEYFNASKNSSLHISPLLIYYGYTNLLYGMMCLKTGKDVVIHEHGMKLLIPNPLTNIGEILIKPENNITGGLAVFSRFYSSDLDLCNSGSWKLSELLGAIPELYSYFMELYEIEPYILPIERVVTSTGYLERIDLREKRIENLVSRIYDYKSFKQNYLQPQVEGDNVFLRKKLGVKETGIYDLSGKKYIQIPFIKNGHDYSPNIAVLYLMLLFSLSYLSRYRSDIWFPFVNNDNSGERLIFDKLIDLSNRILPNIALNHFEGEEFCFNNKPDSIAETEKNIKKHDVERIVQEYLDKQFRG